MAIEFHSKGIFSILIRDAQQLHAIPTVLKPLKNLRICLGSLHTILTQQHQFYKDPEDYLETLEALKTKNVIRDNSLFADFLRIQTPQRKCLEELASGSGVILKFTRGYMIYVIHAGNYFGQNSSVKEFSDIPLDPLFYMKKGQLNLRTPQGITIHNGAVHLPI